jgi:hypothetical protein
MVTSTKLRIAGRGGLASLLAGLSVTACNLVLGIGVAAYDPAIDDAGTEAGPPGNNCATYCALIAQSCTGDNAEYIDPGTCSAMCATFDPGQPGATSGDSLACRITYAQLSASDPVTNCQKAGPLAEGSCSDPCSSFCVLDDALCTSIGLFPYDGGVPSCKAACAQYPYLLSVDAGDAGDAGVGDIVFLSGNTLNCRIYHLESAYNPDSPDASTYHCPHTGVVSATCN